MSIFQAVTMPQDKIVSNSDGSLKPAWLSYFGQIERMSAALDAYSPVIPPQKLAQVVSTETGAVASGSTTIPWDDTIPQITEGVQFLSLSVTPTSATSTLVIQVVLNLANTVISNQITTALFQDATASALAAVVTTELATASLPVQCVLLHSMVAGTTSATTFTVRAGGASVSATTLNGSGGFRKLGGALMSSLTITEVLA